MWDTPTATHQPRSPTTCPALTAGTASTSTSSAVTGVTASRSPCPGPRRDQPGRRGRPGRAGGYGVELEDETERF